MCNNGMLSKFA